MSNSNSDLYLISRSGRENYYRQKFFCDSILWSKSNGGVKAGHVIGEKAVEVVHPLKNVHTTILHLLGLDDHKLTYFHTGRCKQLSQTGGRVIKELLM